MSAFPLLPPPNLRAYENIEQSPGTPPLESQNANFRPSQLPSFPQNINKPFLSEPDFQLPSFSQLQLPPLPLLNHYNGQPQRESLQHASQPHPDLRRFLDHPSKQGDYYSTEHQPKKQLSSFDLRDFRLKEPSPRHPFHHEQQFDQERQTLNDQRFGKHLEAERENLQQLQLQLQRVFQRQEREPQKWPPPSQLVPQQNRQQTTETEQSLRPPDCLTYENRLSESKHPIPSLFPLLELNSFGQPHHHNHSSLVDGRPSPRQAKDSHLATQTDQLDEQGNISNFHHKEPHEGFPLPELSHFAWDPALSQSNTVPSLEFQNSELLSSLQKKNDNLLPVPQMHKMDSRTQPPLHLQPHLHQQQPQQQSFNTPKLNLLQTLNQFQRQSSLHHSLQSHIQPQQQQGQLQHSLHQYQPQLRPSPQLQPGTQRPSHQIHPPNPSVNVYTQPPGAVIHSYLPPSPTTPNQHRHTSAPQNLATTTATHSRGSPQPHHTQSPQPRQQQTTLSKYRQLHPREHQSSPSAANTNTTRHSRHASSGIPIQSGRGHHHLYSSSAPNTTPTVNTLAAAASAGKKRKRFPLLSVDKYPYLVPVQPPIFSINCTPAGPFSKDFFFDLLDEDFLLLQKTDTEESMQIRLVCVRKEFSSTCLPVPQNYQILVNNLNVAPFFQENSIDEVFGINVSRCIQKRNKISLKFFATGHSSLSAPYVFEMRMVMSLSNELLTNQIATKSLISWDNGFKKVQEFFKSDDDIQAVSMDMYLNCPLSGSRITLPARGKSCKHTQCFDLSTYVIFNRKKPHFECPVCSSHVTLDQLEVDEYVNQILQNSEKDVDQIRIFTDGRWTPIKKMPSNVPSVEKGGGKVAEVKIEDGIGGDHEIDHDDNDDNEEEFDKEEELLSKKLNRFFATPSK